jgi:hypothetical protein
MTGDPAQPPGGESVVQWDAITAINGRGHLLIGPYRWPDGEHGGCAFAPPGVMLRTNVPDAPPGRRGWRVGRWRVGTSGRVLFDQDDPVEYDHVQLLEVTCELAQRASTRLAWVAEVVERDLRRLRGRMAARDHCGHPALPDAQPPLVALMNAAREADSAFSAAAGICGEAADHLRPKYFTEVLRRANRQPWVAIEVRQSSVRKSPPCD